MVKISIIGSEFISGVYHVVGDRAEEKLELVRNVTLPPLTVTYGTGKNWGLFIPRNKGPNRALTS